MNGYYYKGWNRLYKVVVMERFSKEVVLWKYGTLVEVKDLKRKAALSSRYQSIIMKVGA